jgi:tetraspanin-33
MSNSVYVLCPQLVGGTLIGLGGWSFLEEYDHTFLKVQNILDIILHISVALMTVGAIIFSMSFAGCLGALRENLFLLKLVLIAYHL